MSAKRISSLRDENPNLQKQIGCMNGILQLFDRHHFLAGRSSSHSQKRLPPEQSFNQGVETSNATMKETARADVSSIRGLQLPGKNLKEMTKDKQRVSVESSRNSLSSSSCTSTFSSVDSNKIVIPESFSISQDICPDSPLHSLPFLSNPSLNLNQESPDHQHVTRDAKLSLKTRGKVEGSARVMKHIDSPRPLQQSTLFHHSNGLIQNLAKLPEMAWNSKEKREGHPRTPKDHPRYSYDERESQDRMKAAIKLKEIPRLSLDSREHSLRSFAAASRSNYLLTDPHSERKNCSQILNPQQEPGSNKRPSNLVAKLMGLEALPDSTSTNDSQFITSKSSLDDHLDINSRTPRVAGESKKNHVSSSPRAPHKDSTSPRSSSTTSIMKPTPSSKFPLETAPWRRPDRSQSSHKPSSKGKEAPAKAPQVSFSVHGEIKKRLTELEFRKSGKDLRPLKQILEGMQKTRERLGSQNEKPSLNLESQTSKYSPKYNSSDQGSKSENLRTHHGNRPSSPAHMGTSPTKRFESPMVVVKPAKIIEKPMTSGSPVIKIDGLICLPKLRTGPSIDNGKCWVDNRVHRDLTLRNNHQKESSGKPLPCINKKIIARNSRSMQNLKTSQHVGGENLTRSRWSSDTVSPRMQQKHEIDKHSCPSMPSIDLSSTKSFESKRARRQSTKQSTESRPPSRRHKSKFSSLQQNIEESSKIRNETSCLNHQGDKCSTQSESNISTASQADTEVTSIDCSNEIDNTYWQTDPKNLILEATWVEKHWMAELTSATVEQPSPISVLDARFYRDGSPSPVKKQSDAFKNDEIPNSDEAEWSTKDPNHSLISTMPHSSDEFNLNKQENIEDLVCKLRLVSFTGMKAHTDQMATQSANRNLQDSYVTEILLAAGLLKDLGSSSTPIQHNSSGHLFDPILFSVVGKGITESATSEHNKFTAQSKSIDKIQRKLIFDTVNEMLIQKLAKADSSELWITPIKLGKRSLNGQKLLNELCSEIHHLQARSDSNLDKGDRLITMLEEDVKNQSENWAHHYHGEFPGIVLHIERLIFKDLITEVVNQEKGSLKDRPKRDSRTLLSK